MKTTVVCGVLGAGKTTFLNNILHSGLRKTVVLVNDFGSVGIDGDILSSRGVDTVELPSGCVCCTLKFDLIKTLEEVMKTHEPEYLFVEPSGVASPSGVIDALETVKAGQVTVVAIVDATDFAEAYEAGKYGWYFKSQVVNSDIVLVNKTDLVDEVKKEKTISLIESLNCGSIIIPTVNARMNLDLLQSKGRAGTKTDFCDHVINVDTVAVKLASGPAFNDVKRLFDDLLCGNYGKVIRGKALVQTEKGPYRFDLASGQVSSEEFGREVRESRVVIIGSELEEEKFRQALAE